VDAVPKEKKHVNKVRKSMTNKRQVQEVSDTIPFQKTVCPELSAGVLLDTSR
jgi:hypothetical protein